jgi:hypothetical protein
MEKCLPYLIRGGVRISKCKIRTGGCSENRKVLVSGEVTHSGKNPVADFSGRSTWIILLLPAPG